MVVVFIKKTKKEVFKIYFNIVIFVGRMKRNSSDAFHDFGSAD